MIQPIFLAVGAELPDNLAGALLDDEDDVGFAAVADDVFRVETGIAGIKPLVGAQAGHGVDVHPVAHAFGRGRTVVGVASHGVLAAFVESEFIEVVAAQPFPDDVAVPVGFHNQVVDELLVGDFGIAHVAVGEHEGVATVGAGFHAGSVVAHGVAFALEVVMVASHPAGFFTGVLDVFHSVEAPGHIAFPVHLNQVKAVLNAEFAGTTATAGHEDATGEDLVGHAEHTLPHVDFAAVHVHEHSAHFLGLIDGEAAPAFVRIVNGNTGGEN